SFCFDFLYKCFCHSESPVMGLKNCESSNEGSFLENSSVSDVLTPLLKCGSVVVLECRGDMTHLVGECQKFCGCWSTQLLAEDNHILMPAIFRFVCPTKELFFTTGCFAVILTICPAHTYVVGEFSVKELLVDSTIPRLECGVAAHCRSPKLT